MAWRDVRDRMKSPVSHFSAVTGGVALVVLIVYGWSMVLDPWRAVSTPSWWAVNAVAVGLLVSCVLGYWWPGSRWALVPVGAAASGMLALLGLAVTSRASRGDVWDAALLALGGLLGIAYWTFRRWTACRAARSVLRGFDVADAARTEGQR